MPTRLLERLRGTGELRAPGRRKRRAQYQLSVLQQYVRTAIYDGEPATYGPGPSPATEPPEVRGTLVLRAGALAMPTGDLRPQEQPTLELADGRTVLLYHILDGPEHQYVKGTFVNGPQPQPAGAAQ